MSQSVRRLGTIKTIAAMLLLIVSLPGNSVLAGEATAEEKPVAKTKLRVALTGQYPPFSYYDSEGNLTGFDVDVAKAIARRMGLEAEIVTTEWDGIIAGLLAGKYDAIIGSMAITEEREKAVNFTEPYYISGAQLFIHKDHLDKVASIEDCGGKKIGVNLGETYEHYLRNNHPDVEVTTYKGATSIFQDVRNGRLVGFVTDRLVGSWQIKKAGEPFVPVGDLLYQERIGIPIIKSRPALLSKINTALKTMRKTGRFDKIHDKYFGLGNDFGNGKGQLASSTIAKKLAYGFFITMSVAAASLLIGFILAIPGGVILNRRNGLAFFVVRTTVDFIRGTPVLIQLFFVYFGAPQIGILLSPMASAIFTLSINAGAYMSEVVRSGLMSVDPGQETAARALGLSRWHVFRHVVWPQAFRIAIPPLMNSVVALTKDTALISIISVGEVIREAQSIISITFNPIRFYLIVAIMFFVVTFPLMKIAGRLEERLRKKGYAND